MQSVLASQDEGIRNEHYGCYLYDKLATTGSLYLTPDYAEICNIGTKKGARNNGMATVMIAGLLHRAQEAHVPHVFLTAAQEAQNIYKKAGFVPVAQADRYILEP
jgi:ribosomal protein S18 acetylase RimI-like enzyme